MTPQRATGPHFYENRARREKALRLARYMYREMLKIVANADHEMWQATAIKAGVKEPSDDTKIMVLEILTGKEPR